MTDGDMGQIPDWYRTRAAAKGMGVAPWELAAQPLVWQEWELTAQAAEAAAQRERERHAERKRKSKVKP